MKVVLGCLASAGLVFATAAQAQMLPPMRGDAVVTVSDFEGSGPYGGPYAAMPPRGYAPPPRYGYVREGYVPSMLPPHEVYAILREAGYSPLGAPQQRGLVYTVSAIDRNGEDGRMVIDARSGRILRFMPAYRMGDRMNEEIVTRYGPEAALPELPQYRRPAFDGTASNAPPAAAAPAPKQKLASRTPTVPLPKAQPPRAVAAPAKPVAVEQPKIDRPVAEKAAEPTATPAPAPVQQSAVTETAVETKAPETARIAPAEEKKDAAPTVAPPVIEAKPEAPAASPDKPAAVQGLE